MPHPAPGQGAGAQGRTVVFGRDLRANMALQQRLVEAQQSMERDYWRMRHMETRYRSLFQVASEAVLIVDANTLKLEEANPAAQTMLGDALRRPGYSMLSTASTPAAPAAVQALLAAVRSSGRPDSVRVDLADGRGEHARVGVAVPPGEVRAPAGAAAPVRRGAAQGRHAATANAC